jgi:hypothetical protein
MQAWNRRARRIPQLCYASAWTERSSNRASRRLATPSAPEIVSSRCSYRHNRGERVFPRALPRDRSEHAQLRYFSVSAGCGDRTFILCTRTTGHGWASASTSKADQTSASVAEPRSSALELGDARASPESRARAEYVLPVEGRVLGASTDATQASTSALDKSIAALKSIADQLAATVIQLRAELGNNKQVIVSYSGPARPPRPSRPKSSRKARGSINSPIRRSRTPR